MARRKKKVEIVSEPVEIKEEVRETIITPVEEFVKPTEAPKVSDVVEAPVDVMVEEVEDIETEFVFIPAPPTKVDVVSKPLIMAKPQPIATPVNIPKKIADKTDKDRRRRMHLLGFC